MGTVALRLKSARLALGQGSSRHQILDNVDFALYQGEIVTVVGPSGSGKSTLLSVMAGLLNLDHGELHLGGPKAQHPGIVFQNPSLFPWLTVAENVALGLRYRRQHHFGARSRTKRLARARQVLDELGIGELADRQSSSLSGGQAQRVAIARAIAVEPAALLLDEPFGALDPRTRQGLQDWLLNLRQQKNLSIVLVTHDVDEALYLGDRVGVLSPTSGTLDFRSGPTPLPESGPRDRSSFGSARDDLLGRLGVSPIPAAV